MIEPLSAEAMTDSTGAPKPWSSAVQHVQDAPATYWLATVSPQGVPHCVPVLAVWADGSLYFSARATTRKARHLAENPRCVVSVEHEPLDIVVEGTAQKTSDPAALGRAAQVYASVYDWHVAVRDGAFHDSGGASTAGPPPYDVYEVSPTVAFGFATDLSFTPTRWRFESRR